MYSHARHIRKETKKHRARKIILTIVIVLIALLGIGAVAGVAVASSWLQDLPDYEDVSAYNTAEKTKVYANDGTTLLAEFYVENREPLSSLDEISSYVVEGTVATEDERFYEHNGVDLIGVFRAVVNNITGGSTEGASTITQQFVRNTVLADEAQESTLKRKVREAYIALNIEQMYSKDQILLMYLNTINYGQGAYGIEAAANLYFSKSAKDLTIAEAATLIGIPQAPTYNNPIDNPQNCLERRNVVLSRMLSNDVITQEEYDEAIATDIDLNVTQSDSEDGLYEYKYFTSYVRETLLNQFSTDEVFKGGLRVVTTIDPEIQNYAEEAVDQKYPSLADNLEIALVAVDPDNGYIKAMIGGKDYDTNQYNLATQAKRQPGSSFKTFTLLAALSAGVSPQTNLNCPSSVTIDNWTVENYGGHSYGTRSIASAYAVSSNTGFAELVTQIGADKVVDMAQTCGIESELEAYPSITLGSEEVTVREMAQAYATIANGGTKHEAICIEKIYDSNGEEIYTADTQGEKVLDTSLTQAAVEVMEGVITNGTGRNAVISNGQTVAGKTGTSENWRDKWFCGITPQLSVAIWIGARDEVQMSSSVAADDVFGNFMSMVLKGKALEDFPTSETELSYTIFDFGQGTSTTINEDTGVTSEGEASTIPESGSSSSSNSSSSSSSSSGSQGTSSNNQTNENNATNSGNTNNSNSSSTTTEGGGSSLGSSGGGSSGETGGGESSGESSSGGGSSGETGGGESGGESTVP